MDYLLIDGKSLLEINRWSVYGQVLVRVIALDFILWSIQGIFDFILIPWIYPYALWDNGQVKYLLLCLSSTEVLP